MRVCPTTAGRFATFLLLASALYGQVNISGRVVDENGVAIPGARVELRTAAGDTVAVVSSDGAGNFTIAAGPVRAYQLRAERQGFYIYQGNPQDLAEGSNQVTIVLNHLQDISERIDVKASAPVIDPQEPSDRKQLDNTEILTVPYPAPQDYRNALPLMDGVVADNVGQPHFNGGDTNQTNYTLDGFNIADPVTGTLQTRLNIDSIQSVDLASSRFSAENGRGSAGVLDVKTKMGDDVWRFGGTNFVPGVSTNGGFHIDKWSPRVEVSGPLAKSRAWLYDGFDAVYNADVIDQLPSGQNRTRGLTTTNLSKVQVNLTPANILTASFLGNLSDINRNGLSFLNPAETTTDLRQTYYMGSIRDQAYFGNGALLDIGFADTRTLLRSTPQGDALFQITPFGDRGNYFVNLDRHAYRQQGLANLFLPTLHWAGTHQLKVGVDLQRESFHQDVMRHAYEVLRDDNSVSRYVQFAGGPFQARHNFDGAQFIQDRWTPREGLLVEAGLRSEWNEVVREFEVAPRFSVAWAPGFLHNTKFSAGWGVYYDAINLSLLTLQQDQVSLATFYPPAGPPMGPVMTSFVLNDHILKTPSYRSASLSAEHKLPFGFYGKAEYVRRAGSRGLVFQPENPQSVLAESGDVTYVLRSGRRDRYDAVTFSVRHTFAGQYEWFAGYTRSSARTDAAVNYSLENPVFAPQLPGPYGWDAPNRFHMWGWAPLPNRILPQFLRRITRDTSAVYLVEYHTGFPFSVMDQNGFLVGAPNGMRLPSYFNVNLAFERKFHAFHTLWAWRFGFNNITNNGNPNSVNNVLGSPDFLTYGRGQARAFNVRLRMLGRL